MVNRDSYPLSDALRIFPIKHLPKPIGYIHSHYRHAAFIQLPSAKPYSRRLIPDPHSLLPRQSLSTPLRHVTHHFDRAPLPNGRISPPISP